VIWYLPIEPLQERYTAQMWRWVTNALHDAGLPYRVIPGRDVGGIRWGQFLDVRGTIAYKASQIEQIAEVFGQVQSGDKFLVGDLWFPGLEAIPYMAELLGKSIEIYGWHYAGVADPHDFVRPLKSWAQHHELGWLKKATVFVGSEFHARLLRGFFGHLNILPIGLAWDRRDVLATLEGPVKPLGERAKRVIFPHRGAPEKNPEAFYRLAHALPYEFVITSSREGSPASLGYETGERWEVLTGLSKGEYYRLLADSRVMFSAAYQETFGYTVQEALTFGTIPVCPNRCSYPEVLSREYLYDDGGVELVRQHMESPRPVPRSLVTRYDDVLEKVTCLLKEK